MAERDGEKKPERPDYLADFPEEFEQRPGGPPRDQARRARTDDKPAPDSALARIEEMKRRVEELARTEREKDEG
jgi:hypothetical protein